MSGLEDLHVWRRSIALVRSVYSISKRFPPDERFGLIAQVRRAAVSVPSNIAEGRARSGKREYARFVSTAQGSLAEVFTQLHVALALEYIRPRDLTHVLEEIDHVSRMLNRLRRALNTTTESRIPNPESLPENPK